VVIWRFLGEKGDILYLENLIINHRNNNMTVANEDTKEKAAREALERAIRRERLIDWLVNVSIYIHQLDAQKRKNRNREKK
jgi:hypothetical protein